jgi:AcrR family transcriptional regulator
MNSIRERLLDAAARVYAETGYRGATTRRIAQEAGVNEITLFRHFGSKTTLILEAVRQANLRSDCPTVPASPV